MRSIVNFVRVRLMVKVDDIIYFYDEYERVEKGKIRSVEKRYVTVSINQT